MIEQAPLNRGRTTLFKNRSLPIQETKFVLIQSLLDLNLVKCVIIKFYCKNAGTRSREISCPTSAILFSPASPLFLFVIWTWGLVGQKLGKGTHRKGPISDQADSPLFHLEEPKTRKPSTDQKNVFPLERYHHHC